MGQSAVVIGLVQHIVVGGAGYSYRGGGAGYAYIGGATT